MSQHLHVDPAGLQVSAARLNDQAQRLAEIGAVPAPDSKPSLVGARQFAAAVDVFAAAYRSRITAHASSLSQAATGYDGADASGAQGISSVPM